MQTVETQIRRHSRIRLIKQYMFAARLGFSDTSTNTTMDLSTFKTKVQQAVKVSPTTITVMTLSIYSSKYAYANCVDPDRTPQNAAFD